MNFDIKTEQLSDDAYVISLAGEVDLYTAPEFKQQLLEVIGQGGEAGDRRPLIDHVHRLDHARRARRRRETAPDERRPALARLSATATSPKIFEITGLDRVFAIYATREEAVSMLDGVSQPSGH